jgi:hypothetical protein
VIQCRYRRDYSGEFVVINTDIRRGIKHQQREWIANPITNQHVSGRAAVIGSTADRVQFDYTRLQRHRGGLQGSKRLQTYATGSIWQDMRLDFYCTTDRAIMTKVHAADYGTTTTVYGNSRLCMMFPGSFFMIPFQPDINDLAAAVYLAAFDGHQEIFLLGYNQDTPGNTRRWQQDVADVMSAYASHQFVLVGAVSNQPDIWRGLDNVECWDYRRFVTYCDI